MLAPLTMEALEDYRQRLERAPLESTSPYSTRAIVKILERVEQASDTDGAEAVEDLFAEADGAVTSAGPPAEDLDTEETMRPAGIQRMTRIRMSRPILMRQMLRSSADTDSWQRVKITGDLEIHYRPTGSPKFLKDVMRFITAAKKMFRK